MITWFIDYSRFWQFSNSQIESWLVVRRRHIYPYEHGVIFFTVITRLCLHRSSSTKSTNLSKSSKRKKHRPPVTATNGSSATTVVQRAGREFNFPAASWK